MAPSLSTAWSYGLLVSSLLTTPSLGASVRRRDAVPAPYVANGYYPAPYTGWIDSWSASFEKAKALVDTMTLPEKANITSGTGLSMGECSSA